MREPENIKAIDQLGVDYLGFIFYPPSPRFITTPPDFFPSIRAKKVGVFVNETLDKILELAKKYQLQTIQLHGHETIDFCLELKKRGFEVIKTILVDANTTTHELEKYRGVCDYLLFDTKSTQYGGTGKKFDWNKLTVLDQVIPYFLSGGLGADDAATIKNLSLKNLAGIDINSRFEIKPGLKDEELIKKFIRNLKFS